MKAQELLPMLVTLSFSGYEGIYIGNSIRSYIRDNGRINSKSFEILDEKDFEPGSLYIVCINWTTKVKHIREYVLTEDRIVEKN